jgi:hypothetical protein
LKCACLLVKVEKWKSNRYIQIAGMRSFIPAVYMIPLDNTEFLEQVELPLSIKSTAKVFCPKIQWCEFRRLPYKWRQPSKHTRSTELLLRNNLET